MVRLTFDGTDRAHVQIVEAIAANPALHVDSREYVEKLDEQGISLLASIAGVEVFRVEHRFSQAPQGASYRSRMVVGIASGALRWPFSQMLRPGVFSNAMRTAWLTHVEEVSMLENILPSLHAARGCLAPRPSADPQRIAA